MGACLDATDEHQGEYEEQAGEANCHVCADLPNLPVVRARVLTEGQLALQERPCHPRVPQHPCLQSSQIQCTQMLTQSFAEDGVSTVNHLVQLQIKHG